MRTRVTLACEVCKRRNYETTKNKKSTVERYSFNKFCSHCLKHTLHKETK